jgi:hypothetical protein
LLIPVFPANLYTSYIYQCFKYSRKNIFLFQIVLAAIDCSNMHALKSLLVAALVATASATYFNGEALRREVLQVRAVTSYSLIATSSSAPYPTPTSSTNSSNACSSVLQGLATLITGLPTPTGALYSYLQTAATTLTDPCVSLNSHSLASYSSFLAGDRSPHNISTKIYPLKQH